jgi:hypothetical protein
VKKARIFVRATLRHLSQRESLYIIVITLSLCVVLNFVARLPQLVTNEELVYSFESNSLSSIIDNALLAPLKVISLGATTLVPSVYILRATSLLVYILVCVALYYALRHWHTNQASILTTMAFASNAVVLGVARYGQPIVAGMGFFIFSSLLLWQLHSRSNKAVPMLVLIAAGITMYIPGAPWFLLILTIVYWDRIKPLFKNVKRQAVLIGILLSLIALLPLLLSFARNPQLIRSWLLLPATLELSAVWQNILKVPSGFIYHMPLLPAINIQRLPVFDIASGVLFLIGLNAYRQKLRLDRTRIMIGSALVGIVLGALGSASAAIIMLLPFAFSVIAAGIEYLLDEWYDVFPKNPFAHSFAILLVTASVLFSMYYQLTRFFVVWPQAPETRAVYKYDDALDSRP